MHIPFDNSYARLPTRFFARVLPTPVAAPRLIRFNSELARELGLDAQSLSESEAAGIFSGNRVPEGAEPIATAYAGHQFGSFVPQLGDGRAILLGEVVDRNGVRRDIQLKGSGPTPFSRRGDGRAAVGPVLREYVMCEAMAALGIPTTRALATVVTGEPVMRETVLPGAILTRVASSHIRVGTFQFFAARRDTEGVRLLADHVIARHYPAAADAANPYRALLDAVVRAQAELIARWLQVGFIHGVMNTDNMSIAGETIDYGPCAFMDEYQPNAVFSSIDQYGRYAYGQQPAIGEWNLSQLAACLLPLLANDVESAQVEANAALDEYAPAVSNAYRAGFRSKIGLFAEREGDDALVQSLLTTMSANLADFTNTFRGLCDASAAALVPAAAHAESESPSDHLAEAATAADARVRSLFAIPADYDAWAARWRARLEEEPMSALERRDAMMRVNPAYIPRNHRVEAVIRAAVNEGDFAPFEELLQVTSRPFDSAPEFARYADPPALHERVRQTFCGT